MIGTTVYFDTCCYGRPFDDLTKKNVKAEISAIMSAINICSIEGFPIIGSPILELEINKIPDGTIRQNVMGFYTNTVIEETPLTAEVEARAAMLQRSVLSTGKMRIMDAYHLALAESAGVVYLLTTDPKFVNAAIKLGVKINVINPINFIQEYLKWLQSLT
jgi:predicted nucleic acid-binding protein